MADLGRFREAQIAGLIAAGVNPLDAEAAVQATLAALPPDTDPTTWQPDPTFMYPLTDFDSDVVRADMRADWYVRAPVEWKRLLDARDPAPAELREPAVPTVDFGNPYHDAAGKFTDKAGAVGPVLGPREGPPKTSGDSGAVIQPGPLAEALASGALDIPPAVDKRKYQTANHDPAMVAYAAQVWAAETAEMRRQGLSQADIDEVGAELDALLRSNGMWQAKALTACLLVADGATPEQARDAAVAEWLSRARNYEELTRVIHARNGPMDDETMAKLAYAVDVHRSLYETDGDNSEVWREYLPGGNAIHYGDKSVVDQTREDIAQVNHIYTGLLARASNPNLVKGAAIVRATSQALYQRRFPNGTVLSRGIYDYPPANDSRYQVGTYEAHEYHPIDELTTAFQTSDSATFRSDHLVAWSTDKRVATTFAGRRDKDELWAKAVLQQPHTAADVALYWPAIYANIGSSIDTKEVWLQTGGQMRLDKTEFVLRWQANKAPRW